MRDMRHLDHAELRAIMGEQPYPLLFATVSGAHLYGFPSRDSDVDLRGVHVLPAAEVVGLRQSPETLDRTWYENGVEAPKDEAGEDRPRDEDEDVQLQPMTPEDLYKMRLDIMPQLQ